MTVKFKMVGKKIKKKNGKTFYFATAAPQGELDLAGLAKHMSMHNTPYSKGQIQGVLQDFVGCLSEILQNGYKVKLNEPPSQLTLNLQKISRAFTCSAILRPARPPSAARLARHRYRSCPCTTSTARRVKPLPISRRILNF